MLEIINDTCKKNFGMTITELIMDMDLNTSEEQEQFSKELGGSLMGKIPS